MADKLHTVFVITPLNKVDVKNSIKSHETSINTLTAFPCSCGVYSMIVIEGANESFLVTQLVHFLPVNESN